MKLNEKSKSMRETAHKNYMNGLCYDLSPFVKLYFLTASAFFGENAYYENGTKPSVHDKFHLKNNMKYLEKVIADIESGKAKLVEQELIEE